MVKEQPGKQPESPTIIINANYGTMRIYLDSCSIQRPLDDRTQLRIAVEAEIILNVFSLIEAKKIKLLSSEVLVYEAWKITHFLRREFVLKILRKQTEFVELDDQIENRSKQFINSGIKPIDALHLASAEKMAADFFCTCDDKLLKNATKIKDIELRVASIIDLFEEMEK